MDEVIDYFGSCSALAEALAVSRPAVSQWVAAGGFPPLRALQIERLSKGRFRAIDISKTGEGL